MLVGIFAHPDDEAFGPSGSLMMAADQGQQAHLISLTRGEAGVNLDGHPDLGSLRIDEWRRAGQLMGAASQICLDYPDGRLCNDDYLPITDQIIDRIDQLLADADQPVELNMLTFEPGGISGHIDHIVACKATSLAYLRLRGQARPGLKLGRLKYFCLSQSAVPAANTDWLYMPSGIANDQIDEIIDVSPVHDRKLAVMTAHHSQRRDAEAIIARFGEHLKAEHFVYFKD